MSRSSEKRTEQEELWQGGRDRWGTMGQWRQGLCGLYHSPPPLGTSSMCSCMSTVPSEHTETNLALPSPT